MDFLRAIVVIIIIIIIIIMIITVIKKENKTIGLSTVFREYIGRHL